MYLGRTKKYKFSSAEIDHCPEAKLKRISDGCKKVEATVWNPHSNFHDYLKKQSAVIYAKYNDEIIGFLLVDAYLDGETFVVALNECMVLKEHHGHRLPTVFLFIFTAHIRRDLKLRKMKRPYTSVSLVSTTVNYKMMAAFKRYTLISDRSSFKPDDQIRETALHYLEKENLEPLDPKWPFIAKAAFPGSIKLKAAITRPAFIPAEFSTERGDAFLLVSRYSQFWMLGVLALISKLRFGFKFSNRVIPISRISRESVLYSRNLKKVSGV
jgi:hypothetical protein